MNPWSPPSLLRWLLIALTGATLYVCWPLWPALVLAAWTAHLAGPLLLRLERTFRGRRRAAGALSLLLFIGLALPLTSLLLGVASGARELAHLVEQQPSAKRALESIATGPESPTGELPRDMASAVDLLERYGTQALLLLRSVAGAAANGAIALGVYFGAAYVFLVNGQGPWGWAKRHLPLPPAQLERFASAFHETGRGLLVGVGLTSATQGVVATLAYLALGVPRWWVLGPITGIASMLPVVGSALVWGPIAAGLFLSGHSLRGVLLLAVGVGLISIADNLLQPLYARAGSLRMPTSLLFVAMFGGLFAFGAWGALLGPIIVRLWLEALALDGEQRASVSADGGR